MAWVFVVWAVPVLRQAQRASKKGRAGMFQGGHSNEGSGEASQYRINWEEMRGDDGGVGGRAV